MSEALTFSDRKTFRDWLVAHGADSGGVWLLFGKPGGPKTLSANDALEEALCFGWIDGQMQSLGDTRYQKYFARRTDKSNWSEKNKKLAQSLIESGLMTQRGMDAIAHAKKCGAWDAPGRDPVTDQQIQDFKRLIEPFEPAYANLLSMPMSVQKTYTGFYLDAKSEKTRQTRLEKIVDRLNRNLKPM